MWKIGAHIIRSSVYGSVFVLHLLFCQFAAAQSTQVYQDDFEGTVTGWSVNNTDLITLQTAQAEHLPCLPAPTALKSPLTFTVSIVGTITLNMGLTALK